MLREEEQRILRCLLVFVDSFDTEAAAAAAQVSPDAMASFLDAMRKRGFLQRSADRQGYRIHPQVRPTIPPLTEAHRQAVMERLHTHYMQRLQRMYATQPFSQTRQWCFQGQNNLRSVLDYLATHRLYPALAEFLSLLTLACAERPPAMLLDWGVAQITKLVDIPDETRAAAGLCRLCALVDSGDNAKAKQLASILEGSPRYAPAVARFWHNVGEGNRARRHYELAFVVAESESIREEAVTARSGLSGDRSGRRQPARSRDHPAGY
jgi:hypothetical protein